jgi:hypothetical protein
MTDTLRERIEMVVSQFNGQPDALTNAILETVRVGADDTPRNEAAYPTPGQLIAMMLDKNGPERLRMAERLLNSADCANKCVAAGHEHLANELHSIRGTLNKYRDALVTIGRMRDGVTELGPDGEKDVRSRVATEALASA